MNHKICEWDQFVILDPEDPIKKKRNNSSKFHYKYSNINPLESLYEDDEDDEYDDYDECEKDEKDDKDDKDNNKITLNFKSIVIQNVSIAKCLYWGDILIKSAFTGCMIYAIFIV